MDLKAICECGVAGVGHALRKFGRGQHVRLCPDQRGVFRQKADSPVSAPPAASPVADQTPVKDAKPAAAAVAE